jgi:hypothetical protein
LRQHLLVSGDCSCIHLRLLMISLEHP